MNSNAIVTLADSNYFELLEELIKSIKVHDQSKNISICVLDAGLTEQQVKILKEKVHSIKKAEWDIKVPGYKVLKKEWLKSQVSRAFIPKYFPEFEKYLWIDFAPHINIGVFSLEKNSKCWSIWQKNLEKTLSKGKVFGSEGLAINIAVYHDNVDVEFLPLKCNWITSHLLPKYDTNKNTFVEPYLPNETIGIIHLAAGIWKNNKDMRLNKDVKVEIKTLEGKKIDKSLRYGIK